MFLLFYRFYRNFSLDSTICFSFLSVTLFLLFKPKRRYVKLNVWQYTFLGAASFSLLFQGVLLQDESLIFSRPEHYIYYFYCHIFLALVWSCLFLQGSAYAKLLYSLFFVASMQMYRGSCMPLYQMESSMESNLYAVLDMLTACGLYCLLGFLVLMFRRFSIQSSIALDKYACGAMLYLLISLLVVVMFPVYLPDSRASSGVIAIILSDLPIVYYIFSRVIRDYEKQRRLDKALARMKAEQASYQRSVELRSRIRQERHELKNHYFRLQVLVHEKKYAKLEQELERVIGDVSKNLSSMETGSAYLDELLAAKEQTAKQAGIPLRAEILLPAEIAVDETSAGTVLANLLDNAIEASMQENKPEITVSMRCIQGYFHCQVSNHISRNILEINPALETTKQDADFHGFGLKIIKKTLQEQEGMLNISVEDEKFIASFLLPLKNP